MKQNTIQAGTEKRENFIVKVLFQQNDSYQGTITILSCNRTINFRSAVEMLAIMDGALKSEQEVATVA